MKKWRCTRCGYIHEGETPPVKCPFPTCGVPANMFCVLEEDPPKADAADKPK
jgi:rubrerythrin